MSVVNDVTTTARKPLYAGVGVADFTVAQIKTLPSELQVQVNKLGGQVKALPEQVKSLPGQAKSLRVEVEGKVNSLSDVATSTYTEFVNRGEKLVTAIRRQPSTQQATTAAKNTKSRAKATTTTAKKAANATEQAVGDASHKVG